jgi:hypothetical protein
MAVPPLPHGQVSAGSDSRSPVRPLHGTRSSAGNLPVTVDRIVGGSLEDDFCFLISWCIEQ